MVGAIGVDDLESRKRSLMTLPRDQRPSILGDELQYWSTYIKYFPQMISNSYGTFMVRTIAATDFYHASMPSRYISIDAVAAPLIKYLWPNGYITSTNEDTKTKTLSCLLLALFLLWLTLRLRDIRFSLHFLFDLCHVCVTNR